MSESLTAMPQPKRAQRQKGWWIPWTFVGAFLVVLAANGTMLMFALDSFTGIETEQAYRKGLAYNEQIDAAEQQAALGWTVALSVEQSGPTRAVIALDVSDSAGQPLDGAKAVVHLIRPTQAGYDRSETLSRSAAGRYEATVELPLGGLWDLRVDLSHDRGDYRLTDRLVLQ